MECMSFNQLFIIPQNLLATAHAASSGASDVADQHDPTASSASSAAVASSSLSDVAATCNPSNADWEPTYNILLALGMIVMILVSVLSAYMEAMLYLKSQQSPSANACKSSSISANKASSNNNNSGITASISSSTLSHHNHQQQQNSNSALSRLNALTSNGKTQSSNLQTGSNKANKFTAANVTNNNCGSSNPQKGKRKNSSVNNHNEKTTTNNSKSISSTTSDKRSSNIYAPLFQNLTNVIASPPPPLPAFDSEEFDSASLGGRGEDFKKLRGKKAAKKSKKSKKELQTSESNSIAEADNSTQLDQLTVLLNHQPAKTTTTATCSSSSSSSTSSSSANSLVSSLKSSASCSSSSSSSTSSNNSSAPSTAPSSTSSSPPLSASSYGEYSLLGPGVTFELPCLRVRSAKI